MNESSFSSEGSGSLEIAIDAARTEDLPLLAGLIEALFRLEPDFPPDAPAQLRGLRRLLDAPPGQARIAVARGPEGPAGVAVAQLVVSTAEGAPSAWIEDVYVLPAWRGRGIGSGLVEYLLAWAREAGATRAQLLADRDNAPALAFYRRLGWAPTRLLTLRHGLDHEPSADG